MGGGSGKRRAQRTFLKVRCGMLVGMSKEGDRFRAKIAFRQQTALRGRDVPVGL